MAMALALPISSTSSPNPHPWCTTFLPPNPTIICTNFPKRKLPPLTIIACSKNNRHKIVRCPPLDRHAAKHNKLRFVRKLTTLLLSKPRHFLPLRILSRCRRYLALPPSRPLLSMILRYPALFTLSHVPSFSSPSLSALSVSLSPAAVQLAQRESLLRAQIATSLTSKLQKLLLLAPPYHRLLLSKLAHLAPDLGLPPNFRSRLCNSHPSLFRTVDTSFGRALELVTFDPSLAFPLPPIGPQDDNHNTLIIDRPPKFKTLKLRRGLNLKRRHRDHLIKLQELPEVNPYDKDDGGGGPDVVEKRACAVVREVLGMATEKRTLVDHLTHFRKEFGLPNRLRGLLVRHPEMFYVSVKGERDSVFLVEAYDDKGRLVAEDELREVKERLRELVREGKRMRRERRRGVVVEDDDDDDEEEEEEEEDDGFGDLFEAEIGEDWEEFGEEWGSGEGELVEVGEFWIGKEETLEAW